MRAGAGLGVALEAECRPVGQFEALQRAVEERYMGHLHVVGQRLRIDVEAMILAGDEYPTGLDVLDGMVGAVLAGLLLDGAAGQTPTEDTLTLAIAYVRYLHPHLGHPHTSRLGH